MVVKVLLVAPIVRLAGNEPLTAWRSALLLAVGGEFGFALLAIAFETGVIAGHSDTGLFATAQAQRAALILVTIDDAEIALRTVTSLRRLYLGVPIIARARDLEQSACLLEAGATQAYPEAVEATLRLGAAALEMIGASHASVEELIQGERDEDYAPIREDGPGDSVP